MKDQMKKQMRAYKTSFLEQGFSDSCRGYQVALSSRPAQEQQPKGMNSYGLDARYFHEKLSLILRNIENYKHDEMYRELSRLANSIETIPFQDSTYEDHDTEKHHEWLKKVSDENAGNENELICDVPAQEPVRQERWVSVEDRLPPRSTDVLCYPLLSAYSHVAWHDGKCWRVTEHEKGNGEVHVALNDGLVTHWMPLPLPPVKEVK